MTASNWIQAGLLLATGVSLLAAARGLAYLRRDAADRAVGAAWPAAVLLALLLIAGLIASRWATQADAGWQPITAHVDGLLLMAALVAWVVLFLLGRPGLRTLAALMTPLVPGLLGWALCPANWRPFATLEPAWNAAHLLGVTLGTAGSAIGAIGGAAYLLAEARLRRKDATDGAGLGPVSLETIERAMLQAVGLGFAALTVGLAAGVVLVRRDPGALGAAWYASPKVWVALAAWLVIAVALQARGTAWRGRRAAWVAVVGFVLLVVVYGVFTVVPQGAPEGGAT